VVVIRPDKELPLLIRRYFGEASAPIERWPAEHLRAYQRDALIEQLSHAGSRNDFYRAKFQAANVKPSDFRALEDLPRFPFTHKDELRGKPWVLLSVPKDQVCLTHTSTGTTGGVWSYVHYSWDDMHSRDWAPYAHELMGIRDSDVVVNALPYEMSSAGQSFQRSLQGAAGAAVVPVGKGGFYSEGDKTAQVMADLAADVLITTPPYAMLLSEVSAAVGLTPGKEIRLRIIWLTGEGCSPAYRRRLETLWKCPALVFYGSLECGPIGIECREQSGCHVSAGHVHLEIVDPQTGAPRPPGEIGEVVCTTLLREAAPLIRYRTQDLATIDPAPCPCGVLLPKVHIRGRIADQVPQSEAGLAAAPPAISPYMIEDVLYGHAEMGGNYQIYAGGGALRIEAERAADAPASESARKNILEALSRRGIQADLAWVEHIPRTGGKTRRIRPLEDRNAVMSERCVLQAALKK
jgi:phenylacetate-CoA ligase